MNYFLTYDSVNGGSPLSTQQTSGNVPAVMTMTQAQWDAPPYGNVGAYYLVDISTNPPSLTVNPNYDTIMLPSMKSKQIATIQTSFNTVMGTPITITLASGASASFTPGISAFVSYIWEFVEKAYQSYVVNGVALPSPFGLSNSSGVFTALAVADITTLYKAMNPVVAGALATYTKAVSDIQSATTPTAVQAVTWGAP